MGYNPNQGEITLSEPTSYSGDHNYRSQSPSQQPITIAASITATAANHNQSSRRRQPIKITPVSRTVVTVANHSHNGLSPSLQAITSTVASSRHPQQATSALVSLKEAISTTANHSSHKPHSSQQREPTTITSANHSLASRP